MNNIEVNPYLFFKGDCRQAMEFYKAVFGGELTMQTHDEVPGPTPPAMEGKIMHASLSGGVVALMASDTEQASAKAAKVTICLSGTDETKLTAIFNSLCEGVEVQYPLKKEFWGDIFGSVTDKFGIDWMVSITPAAAEKSQA